MISRRPLVFPMLLAASLACGCMPEGGSAGPSEGSYPFTEPVHDPLLEPFQGTWTYDLDRTTALWESQGVPAEQIAVARKLAENPALAGFGKTLTIDGHVAAGDPFEFSEYRLFGMHEHGGAVCGKAWHHEDANDPGDMSKCYVKLRRVDGALHLDLWMADGLPALDDPDLTNPPPVASGSAAECDAPADDGPDRNGWSTRVFLPAG